jgi:hypothetical protein
MHAIKKQEDHSAVIRDVGTQRTQNRRLSVVGTPRVLLLYLSALSCRWISALLGVTGGWGRDAICNTFP